MSWKARSLSFSSTVSLPVTPTDSTMPAAMRPMISTTTISSMSVKPRSRDLRPLSVDVSPGVHRALLGFIPVSDVGGGAFAAGLGIRAEREEVVLAAVRARIHVLVIVAPGILAHLLGEVAARSPVANGRVGRLSRQRCEALFRGRILRIVETEDRERRLDRGDVRLGAGDARFVHLVH